MNITFVNATKIQKEACLTVAHNLLNLAFDDIPLNLTVEFVPDPNPESHTEFATTTWVYGSTEALIEIAERAPKWADPWRGIVFLQEVFAHELGHAYFAALPQESRIEIAKMFGAKSDDQDEINPSSAKWENRVSEGIAETFKDAFLPRRFRRYANRTKRLISISRYPEFRAIFRRADNRLRYLHTNGQNTYAIFSGEEAYAGGTVYEPVAIGHSGARQLRFDTQAEGPAKSGQVITARLRPFSTVGGLGIGNGSLQWNARDLDADLLTEIRWVPNGGPPHIVAGGETAADHFQLEILGTLGPYGIGFPEGDLRGINITVPPGNPNIRLKCHGIFIYEPQPPPDGELDKSQDADRLAALRTMSDGFQPVGVPDGEIEPEATSSSVRRVPRRVVGAHYQS